MFKLDAGMLLSLISYDFVCISEFAINHKPQFIILTSFKVTLAKVKNFYPYYNSNTTCSDYLVDVRLESSCVNLSQRASNFKKNYTLCGPVWFLVAPQDST